MRIFKHRPCPSPLAEVTHRDRNVGLVVARVELSTEPENRMRCILASRQQHIILRRVNDWIARAVCFDMAILAMRGVLWDL